MILETFMIQRPITVHPDDTLHHALQIMAWTEVHHLPVTVEDNKLIGVLSERDVLSFRTSKPDLDAKATPVAQAMRQRPQTAAPGSNLTEAAARFAHGRISCLPVTEKGKLVGLVTRTDVLAAEVQASMTGAGEGLTAANLMTRDPETVMAYDELSSAAELMREIGVRHLPVIDDDGKPVGILAEADVQAAKHRHPRVSNWAYEDADSKAPQSDVLLVGDVMSRRPFRLAPDETCASIASLFVRFRASVALVTEMDGTLVGIISYVDLLKRLTSQATTYDEV